MDDEFDERKVCTDAGMKVLLAGGTLEEALTADRAELARWEHEDEQEIELRQARLDQAKVDLATARLRLRDRLDRRQRRSAGSGKGGVTGTRNQG